MTPGAILALNAGSSSIKFALFASGRVRAAHGAIAGIGTAPRFTATAADGTALPGREFPPAATHEAMLGTLLDFVATHLPGAPLAAVGHRVVHGGQAFAAPVRVTPAVLAALDALTPLAPLHQPHNLAPIRALAATNPNLVQVACFDTAFHRSMPPLATRFALPRALHDAGIRRYGFHGLSYAWLAARLRAIAPEVAAGRVIAAHLGNGASLCAMRGGVSVETTMGFTALDGLMMGTRCGALDAGVVLHLLQQRGMTPAAVSDLLYNRSGLLGVSGISPDMHVLLDSPDPRAAEAVALFCARIVREAGALAAALGGLDGLVFAGGIGEHAAPVRETVCAGLGFLGLRLDPAANAAGAGRISAPDSRVAAFVIPTDEEAMIATEVQEVLDGQAAG
jgi:acetate kinase